jgi:hypothetical protein
MCVGSCGRLTDADGVRQYEVSAVDDYTKSLSVGCEGEFLGSRHTSRGILRLMASGELLASIVRPSWHCLRRQVCAVYPSSEMQVLAMTAQCHFFRRSW